MSTLNIILLALSICLSFLIVYSDNYGLLRRGRYILSIPFGLLGLALGLLFGRLNFYPIDYGFITAPFVVTLVYDLANYYSHKYHQRAFQLHLRGSKHMKGLGLPRYNKHYSLSDIVFSIIIASLTLFWPIGLTLISSVI